MLKRTYALGLLAAATLGCFLTPAAQASQVEVNKQTAAQNAGCWSAMLFSKTLTKAATRTNWITQVQVITIQPGTKIASDQDAKQNGAAVGEQCRFAKP